MEQGYKHFSHSHNLLMHQMPEGIEVSCSGCNSSGTGIVFVCWQCNFFLHEQCFKATRSLKHPSHLHHPLTLVPYPTYPSNSFYFNSCEIIGTGLCYSCADCEFDLHVQCAYSISSAASFQQTHQYQELVAQGWNVQKSNMAQNQFTGATNPYMAQGEHFISIPNTVTGAQYPSTAQNPAYVSIPTSFQTQVDTNQEPLMAQTGPSISVSTSSQNRITSIQYPSIGKTELSVSIPMSSQNLDTSVQYPSISEPGPSVYIPTGSKIPITSAQYQSMAETGPSVSIPTNSQNPITSAQYPSMAQTGPSVSIPTNSQTMAQDVCSFTVHTKDQDPITSVQNSSVAQNTASFSIPTSNHVESGENGLKDQGIMHFSHPHGLLAVELQDGEEEVACSVCEETLVGKGYSCAKPKCEFHIHESCFLLKKEIRHDSHPDHPLTLLSSAPYNNRNGEFTCNACFSDGTGFTYHCSICKFDLHIQCVSLPETVKRSDHEHVLKLCYSCPMKSDEDTYTCEVCRGVVQKDRWMYTCETCDYGTHLGCVDCEKCEGDIVDSVLDAQVQLQRLQIQMEMVRQNAQFMASLGASLSNMA